jgi:lipoprotein signal peptidase
VSEMPALILALGVVPLIDQSAKLALRHRLGTRAVALGPVHLRIADASIWLARIANRRALIWTLLTMSGVSLVIASAWIPSARLYIGLLLGGAFSNALECSLRGKVGDYVHPRFWPAFNLADVAIVAGATGVLIELAVSGAAGAS